MIITNDLNGIEKKNRAVALGIFDGVHKGHRRVIETAVQSEISSCVFTIKSGGGKGEFIYSDDKKAELIADLGIEMLVAVSFSEIKDYSPERFFSEILIEKLGAKVIVVGDDFRFGKDAKGDIEVLESLCVKSGVELVVVLPVSEGHKRVSSSEIKSLLKTGDIKGVNHLLTEQYSLSGKVIEGKKLGRTIGFPTANIEFALGQAVPMYGVYKTKVSVLGKTYNGITSIGVKPTVGGENPLCESHILNFNADIYGEDITVNFIDFIREERKMQDVQELSEQISEDIKKAFANKGKV